MRDMEESRLFNRYVNRMRKKYGISMRQVCEGLCSFQELSLLENGRRQPNRLLQDAIVERLGVDTEDYEIFLGVTEYKRWEVRQRILHCITWEETGRADRLLEEYYTGYGKGNTAIERKLERQFYLSMLAQILRYGGASREKLWALFDEAVRLTVPALEHKPISQLTLSIKELNLILEAEQYRRDGARLLRYREILTYIEGAGLDGLSMAKIYPKAVFFLCRERLTTAVEKPLPLSEMAGFLQLCSCAVDILRNNNRMYFLWELLDMRGQLLKQMAERYRHQGEPKAADTMRAMHRENTGWKTVLEQIYAEFQVPKKTFEYCYLYVMQGVSCINDVIKIRRQMLGITPGELCNGICDVRTLRRMEHRSTMPQRAIVERLFARLGLSGEFTRTELVTDDPEAKRSMEKMWERENNQQWEEAENILKQLKTQVSMDIPGNRQALTRRNVLFHWKKGVLGNDEYCRLMREILELTLPFKAFLIEGEKYLTYEEQICIQNMLLGMDRDREEYKICIERFEQIYCSIIGNELQATFAEILEYIVSYIGSELGYRGEYDKSDQYSANIIQNCLRLRRVRAISENLYNRWRNYAERERKGVPANRALSNEEELNKCILLSRLCKCINNEIFYSRKLETAIRDMPLCSE